MIISLLVPWLPAMTLLMAAVIQELALPLQAWSVFRPDLVLVSLVYWRLYRPDRCPPEMAFAIGLVVDVISGTPLGLHALSNTLLAVLVSRSGNRLRGTDFVQLLPVLVLLTGLMELLQLGVMTLLQGTHVRWPLLLGRPVATGLTTPLVFSALIQVHQSMLEKA